MQSRSGVATVTAQAPLGAPLWQRCLPVMLCFRCCCHRRVIMRSVDVGLNADAIITLIHDYTQVGGCLWVWGEA